VLRVPLLVRAPGIAPRRDGTPASLADVAPTLLALAGLEPLPGGCGRRLLPEPDEPVESFSAALDEIHLGRQRALIVGRDKLIDVERMSPIRPPLPMLSFFDLASDPLERSSLVRVLPTGALDPSFPPPPEAERLRSRLLELAERHATQRAALGVDVDAARVENPELREVGYR
jgi:arylsulfatase A-like enzyme